MGGIAADPPTVAPKGSQRMKASLLFAGMMLAGMTFAVHAAKPETTPEQRKAKAEAMAKKAAAFKASQPQTASQALRTQRTIPGGGTAVRVPAELWTTLSAQQSADGRMQILEADGTAAAPAATQELPHE